MLGFVALGIILLGATQKSKKRILLLNIIAQIIMISSNIFAGLFYAIVQEALTIIRDYVMFKEKDTKAFRIILINMVLTAGVLVTIFFNDNSYLGYIGTFAGLLSTLNVLYIKKNIPIFKLGCAIVNILWFVVYIINKVYTTGIFNGVVGIINIIVSIYVFIMFKKHLYNLDGSKIIEEEKAIV